MRYEDLLREKRLHSDFFWSVFYRIWPEYGDIRSLNEGKRGS